MLNLPLPILGPGLNGLNTMLSGPLKGGVFLRGKLRLLSVEEGRLQQEMVATLGVTMVRVVAWVPVLLVMAAVILVAAQDEWGQLSGQQ
jgi:hypothetical protein